MNDGMAPLKLAMQLIKHTLLGQERIESTEALALRQKESRHIRSGRKRDQSRSEAIAFHAKGLNVLNLLLFYFIFWLVLSFSMPLSLSLFLSLRRSFTLKQGILAHIG